MGDVGSILLGFVYAALVLTLSRNFLEIVCFIALFFPFYADELTTMAVRLRSGENLAQSHRRHLYQLMANELGIAHWKISSLYGMVQLAVGVGVLCVYPFGIFTVLFFLTACFAGFIALTVYTRKCEKNREYRTYSGKKEV
jgi:UDP-N-acetylmuramyl pentapeptide phosphotransferase/UDP-N-acetylglucosamine-1-phosphate transferase